MNIAGVYLSCYQLYSYAQRLPIYSRTVANILMCLSASYRCSAHTPQLTGTCCTSYGYHLLVLFLAFLTWRAPMSPPKTVFQSRHTPNPIVYRMCCLSMIVEVWLLKYDGIDDTLVGNYISCSSIQVGNSATIVRSKPCYKVHVLSWCPLGLFLDV